MQYYIGQVYILARFMYLGYLFMLYIKYILYL